MIPFNPIAGKSDGGVLLSSRKASTSISREPVIHEKAIPTPQIQAIALVVGEHGVADTKTPDSHQTRAIPTEVCDLASIDAKAVFMFSILRSVYEDSVNILAQAAAVERQAVKSCAAGVSQVEQARGITIRETQNGSTGAAIIPRRNAHNCGARTHMKLMGEIHARGEEHGSAGLCGGIESPLKNFCIIGLAISGRAKLADVDELAILRLFRCCRGSRAEQKGSTADHCALRHIAAIEKCTVGLSHTAPRGAVMTRVLQSRSL